MAKVAMGVEIGETQAEAKDLTTKMITVTITTTTRMMNL